MKSISRLIVTLLLILWTSPCVSKEKAFIACIKSGDLSPYNTALEGFVQGLEEAGFDVWLNSYTTKEEAVVKKILEKKPALVLALGSDASKLAKERIAGKIPVLFSMVLNPVSTGLLKSMDTPEPNFTGVSLDIPPYLQFAKLQALLPKAKKLGVIYNPSSSGLIIQQARREATSLGLELIEKRVTKASDVPAALKSLRGECDALWMVPDPVVYSSKSAEYVLLFTLRHSIPFIGISANWVKAGALSAVSCDYRDIGLQGAEQASKILRGTPPQEIPPAIPRKTYLSINLKTAQRLNVKIPKDLLAEAKEIIR
ncbi:ABC transporter substrate-binding protein [bacterium]|nr:ABC transporter substrate-binding protein [bacterium]